jgi:hypothetical protein
VGKPEIVDTILENIEALNAAEGRESRMIGF